MSEQRDIEERLEHYAKLAMPHYPNDLCSQAKREIASLRARLAEWEIKWQRECMAKVCAEAQLASARKAISGLFDGGFIEAGTREQSQWASELAERLKPLRAALTDEKGEQ